MKPLHVILVAAGLLVPLQAQTPAQLRSELKTKETAAKQDVDQLFETAKWAEDKGLTAEAKRICQAIVKLKPDHEGAHKLLGDVLFEGKWMPAKEADALRKKAQEAEYKAKGMVEVKGVYVDKDKVADANKGIFHFEGDKVTREELLALQTGKVRHPQTGELIDAADATKAETLFQIGTEGRWVEQKDADTYHRDRSKPWVLRTQASVLVGSLPLKTLQDVKAAIDEGSQRARTSNLLGALDPTPARRPVIVVAGTETEFRQLGKDLGDETSSYGAFLARSGGTVTVPYLGEVRPAVCHWHEKWGSYYAKHAAGLAYCQAICEDVGAEVPAWFRQGLGSLVSRFSDGKTAGWFGEQHVSKGGVKDLKTWFNAFGINGEMESTAIDANIFQAGLVLAFALRGGDAKVTDAMLEVTRDFTSGKGKSVDKAIDKVEKLVAEHEEQVRDYLKKLVRDKDK